MDAAEVVRRHIEAFNARDLDVLLAGFRDDATWVTGTSRFRGIDALENLFANAFGGLSPTLHLLSLVAEDGRVAWELREDYATGGVRRTDHIAAFYRLEDGLIAAAKVYREGSADV